MKLLLDARLLLPGKLDGIGWYTFELYRRIIAAHPEHEFHLVFDRKPDSQFFFSDKTVIHVVGPPARHPWLFYLWYEWQIPRLVKRISADFFFSPGPLTSTRLRIPNAVTLHDLNFVHFPQDLPSSISYYLNKWTPRFAHAATRVYTVSQFSKDDMVQTLGIDPSRVEVIHNGASAVFKPAAAEGIRSIREKYTQGIPYFVFVSSIHPRKNLVRLLQAFEQFRHECEQPYRLLVVGERFWQNSALDSAWREMKHREDVLFAGAMEQQELVRVISAATALTYVSYFEGFGIPLIEAFQAGVPVIAAKATALPEVGGDAPIWVNPMSSSDIARGMHELVRDPKVAEACVQRGFERAAMFSWDNAAENMWDSWMKLLT